MMRTTTSCSRRARFGSSGRARACNLHVPFPNDRVVKLTDVRCSMLFELEVAVERCVMETSALETGELRFEWEV